MRVLVLATTPVATTVVLVLRSSYTRQEITHHSQEITQPLRAHT